MKIRVGGSVLFKSSHVELNDVFLYDDVHYIITGIDYNEGYATAEMADHSTTDYRSSIQCPLCGFMVNETDSDDDVVCERCGAIYGYTREVNIRYTTFLVKMPLVKLVDYL